MFDKHARARTHTHTHTHTHMHREMVSMTPLPLQITSPWAGLTKRPKNHLDEESRPRAACRANLPTLRTPSTHIPAAPQRAVASAQAHFQPSSPNKAESPTPSSHHQPANLTSSLSGTSSLQWHSWLPSASPSSAEATCCPPSPPGLPEIQPGHRQRFLAPGTLKSDPITVSTFLLLLLLPNPSCLPPPTPPPWVGAGWPRARRGWGR